MADELNAVDVMREVSEEFKQADDWTTAYVQNALRTKSDNFYAADNEAVNIALLSVMNSLKELEPMVDGLKRACFYGNDLTDDLMLGVASLADYYEQVEQKGTDEEKKILEQMDEQLARMKRVDADTIHGILGLFSEACELVQAVMKYVEEGEQVDVVNVREELGDLQWYMAILANATETSFSNMCIKNITKLRSRFPDKFTKEKSDNRDLDKERKILDNAEPKLTFK